jgi:hypothetical protein
MPDKIKISKTLLIGLGGTGNLALKYAKKRLYETYGEGQPYDKFDIPFIKYLALDTDKEDLESGITPKSKLGGLNESEFHHMVVVDPKTLLRSTPYIAREWFPRKNLDVVKRSSISAGAGQIRSLGRLGFMKNFRDIKEKIKSRVEEINTYKTDPKFEATSESLNVIFSFSVAGGTGSGTFLETAYLVKEVLSTMNIKFRSQAYLILPEIFDKVIDKPIAKKRIWGNSYAALRELEFCMDGKLEEDIVLAENIKIAIDEMSPSPFDIVHLISDRNTEGKEYTEKSHLMELVANNIVLKSGELDTKSKSEFDNIKRDIDDIEPVKGQQPRYVGLGYSELKYDTKLVSKYYNAKVSSVLCGLIMDSNSTKSTQELEQLMVDWKIKEDQADLLIDQVLNMDTVSLNLTLDGDGYEGSDTSSKLLEYAEEHKRITIEKLQKDGDDWLETMETTLIPKIIKQHENNFLNQGGIKYTIDIIDRIKDEPYIKTYQNQLSNEIKLKNEDDVGIEQNIINLEKRIDDEFKSLIDAQGSIIFTRKGNCIPIIASIQSSYNNLLEKYAEKQRRETALDFYSKLIAALNKTKDRLIELQKNIEDIQTRFKEEKAAIKKLTDAEPKPFSKAIHFEKIIADQNIDNNIIRLETFLTLTKVDLFEALSTGSLKEVIKNFVLETPFIKVLNEQNITSYLKEVEKNKRADVQQIFKDIKNAGQPLFSINEDMMGIRDGADWVEGSLWGIGAKNDVYNNIKSIVSDPELMVTDDYSMVMFSTIQYPAPIFTLNNIQRYYNDYYAVSKKSYDVDSRLRDKMDEENFELIPRKNESEKTQFAWIFGIILNSITDGKDGVCRSGSGNYKVKSDKQGIRKNEFWVDLETPWRDDAFEKFREKYLEAEILDKIKQKLDNKGIKYFEELLSEVQANDQLDYVEKYSQLNKDFSALKRSNDPRDKEVLDVISAEQDFIKALRIETISEYLK